MNENERRAGPGVRQRLGAHGEAMAADHLHGLGWEVVERNWRCPSGEIDLIAVEPDGTVVFCEVKTRRGVGFGDPLDAITYAKQRKLRELVACWLSGHSARAVRIDAIGVLLLPRRPPVLRHERGIG